MRKSVIELRKFGLILAGVFAGISILFFLRSSDSWQVTVLFSAFFLLVGSLVPELLRPVEKFWMKLAAVMGFVMTSILLTLVFFVVVTPIGLIMRLFGNTPLKLDFHSQFESFWVPIDPNGPCSRPDKPY